ncbi:MAG: TlpA family protein disulfide reductase [Epsilonproteobacteria bacterium]|nr:hypothetical protein [Campylobacterota bacterium]NPA57147.1 TlpA family protein disulfide reductase [Campylobacterota bacterium]
MVRWLLSLFLVVSLFGAQGQQSSRNESGQGGQATATKRAPTENFFEVTTVDGKKFHFLVTNEGVSCKECKGKVLIMDFFGKHCPPCRASIPTLAKLQKEMGDKLQIVSFHVQEKLSQQDLKDLRERLGLDYPIVDMMGDKSNYQFVEYIGRASGWQNTIPYMLFFAPDGRYMGHHYGMVDYNGLKRSVQQIYDLVVNNQGVIHKGVVPEEEKSR